MGRITRKEAREIVSGLLFETEFRSDEEPIAIYAISEESREIPKDDYIKRVYFGVCENREVIDELIGKSSKGWKTYRLTRVSRSIMRIAVYEMLFEQGIPHNVSINEAIELTKKYDDPKLRSFVNGVLNSVKDEIEAKASGEEENG